MPNNPNPETVELVDSDGAAPIRSAGKHRFRILGGMLLFPVLGLFVGAFLLPIFHLLGQSFDPLTGGGYTLDNFGKVLNDTVGQRTLMTSVQISLMTSAVCIVLGFPLAYQAARSGPLVRTVIIGLVTFPLFTSAVVRSFGWQILMFPNGTITSSLRALGWSDPPVLIGTSFGVVIALSEVCMPFMVLTLVGVIRSIDASLEEAALDLGDPPIMVWFRVTLPLSLNGLVGGSMLVFAMAMSSYATPKLIGQSRVPTLSQAVFEQSMVLVRYPVAAAFAVVLLIITLAVSVLAARLTRVEMRPVV